VAGTWYCAEKLGYPIVIAENITDYDNIVWNESALWVGDGYGVLVGKGKPTFGKSHIKACTKWDTYIKESGLDITTNRAPAQMNTAAFDAQMDKMKVVHEPLPPYAFIGLRLLKQHLRRFMKVMPPLKVAEVYDGVKDEDGELNPIDLSTSPGYLFSDRGKKRDWVLNHSADFKRLRKLDAQSLKDGLFTYNWIWRLSLKSETRDLERVVQNKTRVFCAAPFPILLSGRKYCGNFVRQFYNNNTHNHFLSKVGLNVYGGGWDRMMKFLNLTGKGFESDITGQDKKMCAEIIFNIGKVFGLFSTNPQSVNRHFLRYIYKVVVDLYGNIFELNWGNPSGGPETVVINTLCVMWIFFSCYAYVLGTLATLEKVYETSRFGIFGDDTIGESTCFDFSVWQKVVSDFGFDCTGEAGELNNLTFLGRKSIVHSGFSFPSLGVSRILSILAWTKNESDEAFISRIVAAYTSAFPLFFTQDAYILFHIKKYVQRELDRVEKLYPDLSIQKLPSFYELCSYYTGYDCMFYSEIKNRMREFSRDPKILEI
jgi:hypothetical protein